MASEQAEQDATVITSTPTKFLYASPERIREISWQLASKVVKQSEEWKPELMVALWRGGAPVGVYMHEYFKRKGMTVDHIPIRTSSYVHLGEQSVKVRIQSLHYIIKHANKDTHLLLVDDIFDSGHTLQAFIDKLHRKMGDNAPQHIRIATPYWKPENNKTSLKPDYVVELVPGQSWVAFPHEISDHASDEQLGEAMGADTLRQLQNA